MFELDTAGILTVLHSFGTDDDGAFPAAGLVRDAAGTLYGTTVSGGTGDLCSSVFPGCGTIFKIDAVGNETVLFSFPGKQGGAAPPAAVVLDSSGNVYGTLNLGGTAKCSEGNRGCGAAFEYGQGKERIFHAFLGGTADGAFPEGPLLYHGGLLYGTTGQGGEFDDCGTIFKITLKSPSGGASKR